MNGLPGMSGLRWTGIWVSGIFALTVLRAAAITASPDWVEVRQPDGSKQRVHIRGDEYIHWYEDADGYAVVRDSNNRYVYAVADAEGKLKASSLVVGRHNPLGLAKGLRPSREAVAAARSEKVQRAVPAQDGVAVVPESIAPQGTVKNLVVLCKFADHVTGTHTRVREDYDVLFNHAGSDATLAPTGSVRDYYTEASYGVMNLQSTVVAWVTLPQTQSYYANGADGLDMTYPNNAQGMVRDALNLVEPLVNFGDFDQDNDGYIDSITIIHSGYGSETGGGGGNWIWSHRWSLWALPGGEWTSQDTNGLGVAVKVYDYHTEPALWGTSGTGIVRVGVICHETGHFFGLPDLYDTDNSSSGIGSWCMMANSWGFDGSQLHPPHFSAWCKQELGWITPTVITAGDFALPQVETSPTVFKITTGFPSGEYLLIENRQPVGFESDIPQGGLAVWHIDGNKTSNTDEGYPGQSGWPANNQHYKVALLQADGLYELERDINRGNAGDLFRSGGISAITPVTVPSTNTYQNGIVASSNNFITAIGAPAATMTFTLNATTGPPEIVSATEATAIVGESFSYQIAATNNPTGYEAGGLPATLTFNATTGAITGTPTEVGTYAVALSATNHLGTGEATLTLRVVLPVTLAEALDTPSVTWTTGGNVNWKGQLETSHDGEDSAQSGAMGDSQTGYIETTVTGPLELSFWWKVSSEEDYDMLRFMVDGVAAEAISGVVDWQQKTMSIAAGSHTLRWQYSKDGSVAAGMDAAWVDQVVLGPPVVTVALAEALDTLDLEWTTGGATPWIGQTALSHDGEDAGVSGKIGDSNISWVQTTVTGPALLTFWWQVSSEPGYDFLSFMVDGNAPAGVAPISGLSGWQAQSVTIPWGTHTLRWQYQKDASSSSGADAGWIDQVVLTPVDTPLTLAEALDTTGLVWVAGGDADWVPQLATAHDGEAAAMSGAIGDDQRSFLQTWVAGPGVFSFWWKVSSEADCDGLHFTVDGVEPPAVSPISGAVDWQQQSVTIGAGWHTLRWVYAKNASGTSGSDAAWVDQVSWLSGREFAQIAGMAIPSSGNATPYPSVATVSGITEPITAVRVKLNGVTHSYADDLDIFLVSPSGKVCVLMSDAGGPNNLNNANLVFDNAAASDIPDATAIASGSYRPANYDPTELLPPGATGTIGNDLLALATGEVNGDWKLYVADDAAGDYGTIGSWSITLTTHVPSLLETWRQTHFGSSNNHGDAADSNDFDQDGLSNLTEFAFGLDPRQSSGGLLPMPVFVSDQFALTFDEPAGMSGIVYGAEWSQTLGSNDWTPITDTGTPPQHTFSVPTASGEKLFLRLKVLSFEP